ncbi:MAG: nucleoside permease [Halieaceae bacterium]|jgi:nucleoside transporter
MDTTARKVYLKLSAMMFLQFFIWGSWFVTLGAYLGGALSANGMQIGAAFSTQSWGAIIAPFFIGLVADRYFSAQKVLAVLHLSGAILMYWLYRATAFTDFYPLLLLYMVCYMPTLALVNSISFRQLTDTAGQFSKIRVWGTVGWIAAGLAISYVFSWDSAAGVASGALRNTFLLGAVSSLLLSVFSLFLPPTPPVPSGTAKSLGEMLGLDAIGLFKDLNFALFFVLSILICIPLAFYYQHASPFLLELGVENATGKMTLGQVSEVGFMLLLPFFLGRFGIKFTLLIGMLAWVVRYLLFAFGDADGRLAMLILGIALHGVCYDFFFVAGQIYTDSKAGERHRSSVQGLITLATYGVGMLIGFSTAGYIADYFGGDASQKWQSIWLFPAAFAAGVTVLFLLAFKDRLQADRGVVVSQ